MSVFKFNHVKSFSATVALFFVATAPAIAQNIQNNPTSNHGNKFEQLGTILPDANTYRTASGAPGHEYWQQRADYQIKAILDEKKQYLHGEETITYFNNSPDGLTYLWLQLDENEHNPNGENNNFNESGKSLPLTPSQIGCQSEISGLWREHSERYGCRWQCLALYHQPNHDACRSAQSVGQ
ncbi:MAG: hypothetical protein RLZZ110_761 [Bacteroidota bacterium]